MDFGEIGNAILMVFDELEDDDKSTEILDILDGGESDNELKDGLKKGIARLRELGKNDIADTVEGKIKNW